jgi:hypothetical protein
MEALRKALDTVAVIGPKECVEAEELLQLLVEEEKEVQRQKVRNNTLNNLKLASSQLDITALRQAIARAEELELQDRPEYSNATEALVAECNREEARIELRAAIESRSIEALRQALDAATVLDDSECDEAEQLLSELEQEEETLRLEEEALRQEEEERRRREEDAADAAWQERQEARERDLQENYTALRKAIGGDSPEALELAIDQANQAGIPEEELCVARVKLMALQEMKRKEELLEKVNGMVQDACDKGTEQALRNAIAFAEENEFYSECSKAKELLELLEKKRKARTLLDEAYQCVEVEPLQAAIAAARAAEMEEFEYKKAVELLPVAAEKDRVRNLLAQACGMQGRGREAISALKEAIAAANRIGLAHAEAADVLDVEKKKVARAELESAVASCEIEALREAIRTAKESGLEASEFEPAEILLREEERKVAVAPALKILEQRVVEGRAVVKADDMEIIFEAKEKLKYALAFAKKYGAIDTELTEAEMLKKKLHNLIEDMKGSIRVFCRVRPLSKKEIKNGDGDITRLVDPMTVDVLQTRFDYMGEKKNTTHTFHFDAVFMPGSQEYVHRDCEGLVETALQGKSVTIFAYGQTGSGKTYTMFGPKEDTGIALRTVRELYEKIQKAEELQPAKFTVTASVLELYCSEPYDLLVDHKDEGAMRKVVEVKHDAHGNVVMPELTERTCTCVKDLKQLLDRGSKKRATFETLMNTDSSRSHLILLVNISRTDTQTRKIKYGKLVLCDLAGSERLKKSQSTELRMKEAIEINKSLSALGDVIAAVTEGAKLVPYKHHKLTEILQGALGGTSKALMFVNCSPASSNFDETMMSLNFATRAKKISDTVTQRFLRVNSATAGGDAFEHIEDLRRQYLEIAEGATVTDALNVTPKLEIAECAALTDASNVAQALPELPSPVSKPRTINRLTELLDASGNFLDSDDGSGEGTPESEEEEEVLGSAAGAHHASSPPQEAARDIRGSLYEVSLTDSDLQVGTVLKLKSDLKSFKRAVTSSGYVWNDAMKSILGSEQAVVVAASNGVFGLREAKRNSGQPVWYYPIGVVESVQAAPHKDLSRIMSDHEEDANLANTGSLDLQFCDSTLETTASMSLASPGGTADMVRDAAKKFQAKKKVVPKRKVVAKRKEDGSVRSWGITSGRRRSSPEGKV